MSTPDRDDRDLEELLRRALQEQAARVHPVGDGLAKIQRRAVQRHRRRSWMRPVVAAAAAAFAVVAAVEAPSLLDRSQQSNDAVTQSGARPKSSESNASPLHATTQKQAPTPIGPAPTMDSATLAAWPYGDRASAMANAGKDVSLRSPQKLAQSFVNSFISTASETPVTLTTEQSVRTGRTVTVSVDRPDLGREICTVQLMQLASAPLSYVVTGASSDNLTVRAPAKVTGAISVPVSGMVSGSEPVSNVWSALLVPNGSSSGTTLDTESTGTPTSARWSIPLNLKAAAPAPAVVAAWTVDDSGKVLDFAATGAD